MGDEKRNMIRPNKRMIRLSHILFNVCHLNRETPARALCDLILLSALWCGEMLGRNQQARRPLCGKCGRSVPKKLMPEVRYWYRYRVSGI